MADTDLDTTEVLMGKEAKRSQKQVKTLAKAYPLKEFNRTVVKVD